MREAEARAVAERGDDLLLEPGGVDDDLAHAAARRAPRGAIRSAACRAPRAAAWAWCRRAAASARRGRRRGSIAFIAAPRRVRRAWRSIARRRERRRPARPSAPRRAPSCRRRGCRRRRRASPRSSSGQVWTARCDSASRTTPVMPLGAAPARPRPPARSDGTARRPACRPARGDRGAGSSGAGSPARSSPAGRRRSRAGRRSGEGPASARLSGPGRPRAGP